MASTPKISNRTPLIPNNVLELAQQTLKRSYGQRNTPTKDKIKSVWTILGKLLYEKLLTNVEKYESKFDQANMLTTRIGGQETKDVIPGVHIPYLGELVWLRSDAPVTHAGSSTSLSSKKKILKLHFIGDKKFLTRANLTQPSSSLVSHGRSRPPSIKLSTFGVAKDSGLRKDLTNAILQAVIESYANIARKSTTKPNMRIGSTDPNMKKHILMLYSYVPIFISVQSKKLKFHGKKASVYLRSKRAQERLIQTQQEFGFANDRLGSRLVHTPSSVNTSSSKLASRRNDDDLNIVDIVDDDDASSLAVTNDDLHSISDTSSIIVEKPINDKKTRARRATNKINTSNNNNKMFAGGNDLLKDTWNNDNNNSTRTSAIKKSNLRNTRESSNRHDRRTNRDDRRRNNNRTLAWTTKYMEVDSDATDETLKSLIGLIATFQAVDRDHDGIIIPSDLRSTFRLSIDDSNDIIRELRGRGRSGRGTISGITVEDFVWGFRSSNSGNNRFRGGNKHVQNILKDMRSMIEGFSRVNDVKPTSGRHLRDQIMMQVRPSDSLSMFKLGIDYHVLKSCIEIMLPSISENDVVALLDACKDNDNLSTTSMSLKSKLDYGKLWCKPRLNVDYGIEDELNETGNNSNFDDLISPIRRSAHYRSGFNETTRPSGRNGGGGGDRRVTYNGAGGATTSYRERPTNRSFSRLMGKESKRNNTSDMRSGSNINDTRSNNVKKAIFHFHDWLLSKRLTLTAAFRLFDKKTQRKINSKDFLNIFSNNGNRYVSKDDLGILVSHLFQRRHYVTSKDFIAIMKLPEEPKDIDWEETILQNIRTWVMKGFKDTYSAFQRLLSHKPSSHIRKKLLDADQLRKCLEKENFVISSAQADRLLRLLDVDNDKYVGLKDFESHFGVEKSNNIIKKLQEMLYNHHLTITELIGYLDENNDGIVTYDEWVIGLKKLEPKLSSNLIREIGTSISAQGSGRTVIDLELLRKRLQQTFESHDKMWKTTVLDRIRDSVKKSTGFGNSEDDGIGNILERSLKKQNRRNERTITRTELTRTLRGLGCHLNMSEVDQIMMIASGGIANNIDSNSVGIEDFTTLFKTDIDSFKRSFKEKNDKDQFNWIIHILRLVKIYQKVESLSNAALFRIHSEKHTNSGSLISRSDFIELLNKAGLPSSLFSPSDEHYEALFEIFDLDKDGFLNNKEFLKFLSPENFKYDNRVKKVISMHLGESEMESLRGAFNENVMLRPSNAWGSEGRKNNNNSLGSGGRSPYAKWSLSSLRVELFDRLYRRRHSPKDLFNAIDRDNDGYVSLDDLTKVFHNESNSTGPNTARQMISPLHVHDSYLYVHPKVVRSLFNLIDIEHVGYVDLTQFEKFSDASMGFAVSTDQLVREIKKRIGALRWRVEKCFCFLALSKTDGGIGASSSSNADPQKFDPGSDKVQRTIASISLDVAQLRKGLIAMGIPYMSTEQVERLAHLIDTSGRGKITYKDFAAKFRPGQLKFGWLEEALKVIGRSFTTKRRGGQVEKDADKELRRLFKEKFGRRLKVCPSASEFELWMLSNHLFGANMSQIEKLNLSSAQWVELYNRADTKSDGVLDEDEFVFTFSPFEVHVQKLQRIREIAYELAPRGDHRGMFEEFDTNKDGFVDHQDFKKVLMRINITNENDILDLWEVFSPRGNAVSYSEFQRSIIVPVQAKLTLDFEAHAMKKIRESFRKKTDNLDLIFKTFDTDGDGELSPEELRRGLSHIGFNISAPELEQLVKAIDSNEDGQIQLSEFKYWLAPKPEETEKRDMMEIRRKKVVDLIMKTYQTPAQAFYKFGGKKIGHNIRFPILRLEDFVEGLRRLFKKYSLPSPTIEQAAYMFNTAGSVRGTLVQEKFVKYFSDWRAVPKKKMLRTARRAEIKKKSTSVRTSLW